MKNINELIGIVKGINFDDVVNEKEVEHLQAWVDQNRNLAYEPQQAFLLELLDKVLEDNVITDDEREILLSTCLGFEKTGSYELSSIDELNGIIEGIICDGKVNEEEIRSLRNWMEDNKNILVIDKNSNGLLSLIDEILEDDIVTEQEQEKILFFLNERLEDIKLNVKLDQLRKDVKERKNIGLSLIDSVNLYV
ncbi:hypothetical protein [uncultured Dubosiella sp.]|uniref:hypothetical protein n=1 Tax=uncultured Dubosiella sp. TaxID=1937011 RepID=UPI0025B402C2|nr:hypothetical protein [uncultured Dubosiella sp.]